MESKIFYTAGRKAVNNIRQNLYRPINTYYKDYCSYPEELQLLGSEDKSALLQNISHMPEKEIILYIHLPFCSSLCVFCNMKKCGMPDKEIVKKYFSCLEKEIEMYSKNLGISNKIVRAVYLGGGTPSSVSSDVLYKLIDSINEKFILSEDVEFTIEVHPRDILRKSKTDFLKTIKSKGINRISIGIQSLDNKVLKINNRGHTAGDAKQACSIIKDNGFILSADMMFGLPGQFPDSVRQDLKKLENIEKDTVEYFRTEFCTEKLVRLFKAKPKLFADDDSVFKMNELVFEWLLNKGYEQQGTIKENNKFYRYRYLTLKQFPVIGLGICAQSQTSRTSYQNCFNINSYCKIISSNRLPITKGRVLTKEEIGIRKIFISLQLKSGLDVKKYKQEYGKFPELINKFKELKVVEEKDGFLRLTKIGSFFTSDICSQILKI
mgnify:CR=1 FL=1